jgi:hypothetical protein
LGEIRKYVTARKRKKERNALRERKKGWERANVNGSVSYQNERECRRKHAELEISYLIYLFGHFLYDCCTRVG